MRLSFIFVILFFLFQSCQKDIHEDGAVGNLPENGIGLREGDYEIDTINPYSDVIAQLFTFDYYNSWVKEDPIRLYFGEPAFDYVLTYYDKTDLSMFSRNFIPLVDYEGDSIISFLYVDFREGKKEWNVVAKSFLEDKGDSSIYIDNSVPPERDLTGSQLLELVKRWEDAIFRGGDFMSAGNGVSLRGGDPVLIKIPYLKIRRRIECPKDGCWWPWWGEWKWRKFYWKRPSFNWHIGGGRGSGKLYGADVLGGVVAGSCMLCGGVDIPSFGGNASTDEDGYVTDMKIRMCACLNADVEADIDQKTKELLAKNNLDSAFCAQWTSYYNHCLNKDEEMNKACSYQSEAWARLLIQRPDLFKMLTHSLKCTSTDETFMIDIKTHKGMINLALYKKQIQNSKLKKGVEMERKAGILQEGKAAKTKLCSA